MLAITALALVVVVFRVQFEVATDAAQQLGRGEILAEKDSQRFTGTFDVPQGAVLAGAARPTAVLVILLAPERTRHSKTTTTRAE